MFNPTRIQSELRSNIRGLSNYVPFSGSDEALRSLLSGNNIDKNAMLATAQDTVVNPLKVAQQQLLEQATPAINQAASAGGTRFSSRSGNVLGDLLQDANRQATTVIGSELGKLEQTRLLANQAAQLQGIGLARQRESQPINQNAALLQQEELFRQLRQQRIQSTLPAYNPLLGSALQFGLSPTIGAGQVQNGSSGGIGGALGGFLGGSILGSTTGGFLGAGIPGLPGNVGGWLGGIGGFF